MPARYTGPAMDLANMRSLGIRAVDAACACGRRASVDVLPMRILIRVVRNIILQFAFCQRVAFQGSFYKLSCWG